VDEVFGPFRLVFRIARGGMAETFVAVRTGPVGFEQRVCVKRIVLEDQGDPKRIALFKKEARIAGTLRHQNIATLHDFNRERGVWWMSFELIEGATLRELATLHKKRGTRIPLDHLLFVISEVASALAYAHSRTDETGAPAAVVHRDVTPKNILISHTGAVKLVDFGIATVLERERTRTGRGAGKVPYMPPEQHPRNDGVDVVDGRTDLFALGVVLFEMLAGTRPYDGVTDIATMMNVGLGRKKDLRALAPATPEPIVQLVEWMIASDVDARIPSAEAVLDALEKVPGRASARALGALAREARGEADAEAKATK
jgi:serine/threonine protein kinase